MLCYALNCFVMNYSIMHWHKSSSFHQFIPSPFLYHVSIDSTIGYGANAKDFCTTGLPGADAGGPD